MKFKMFINVRDPLGSEVNSSGWDITAWNYGIKMKGIKWSQIIFAL